MRNNISLPRVLLKRGRERNKREYWLDCVSLIRLFRTCSSPTHPPLLLLWDWIFKFNNYTTRESWNFQHDKRRERESTASVYSILLHTASGNILEYKCRLLRSQHVARPSPSSSMNLLFCAGERDEDAAFWPRMRVREREGTLALTIRTDRGFA